MTRTVLRGTTVVDVRTGALRPDVDVTVDAGRITSIGPTSSAAVESVTIVDARETYTVPGFCDMHAHPLADRGDPEPALQLMLANGVTAFRQMSGSLALLDERARGALDLPGDGARLLSTPGAVLMPFNAATEDAAVETVRRQAEAGADFIKVAVVTPPVFFAAQAEATRLGLRTVGHLPMGINVRAVSDGRMHSIEHLGPGIGIIAACCSHESDIDSKLASSGGPRLPAIPKIPFADRLIELLAARALRKVLINPLMLSKPADAELVSQAVDSFNDEKTAALARTFAADGTWQCPTLIRVRTQQFSDDPAYANDPNNRFANAKTLKSWQKVAAEYAARPARQRTTYRDLYSRQLDMVRIFDASGVKMLTGSDVSGSGWEIPGFALHQEFDQLSTAGLSALRILQMATLNAAEFLGRTDTMGTVEAGKDADLVLLRGNPVAHVANLHDIAGVMRSGQYFSADRLAATTERIAEERSAV